MMRKNNEVDQETYYKEAFRVFFKDEDGCVPAEELKGILRSLNVMRYCYNLLYVVKLGLSSKILFHYHHHPSFFLRSKVKL